MQDKYQTQIDDIMKELESEEGDLEKTLGLTINLRIFFIKDYQKLSLEEIQRYGFLLNAIDRLQGNRYEEMHIKELKKMKGES
ncbi:MAG: hypothetical protein PHH54_03660 [Candidatus Nanoarchaeia archaeon]|nr:hypothetical protein [Candidatus Nanoarchaeia archaeon]MDD5741055.1 hypothetical protein [Candidatus Nanoarchaeia archaeon]